MYSLCCNVVRSIKWCDVSAAATAYNACRGMAGHSKWQNIKATKGANDAARSMVFSRLILLLKKAVQDGGGNIKPETNSKLAEVIKQCKAAEMPNTTLQRALANTQKKKSSGKPFQMEFIGAENSCFLVDIVTSQKNQKERVLANIFSKLDMGAPRTGLRDQHFDFFCYINAAPLSEAQTVDDALEHAIDIAANDVTEDEEDGVKVFRFECDPLYFDGVMKGLEKLNYTIKDYNPALYVPKNMVELSPETLKPMLKTVDKLNAQDFVENVHHNISNLDS